MNYSVLRYLIKLTFSISIIIFITSKIDWTSFVETLKNAKLVLLGLAFFLIFVERFWSVLKWKFLLNSQNISISVWRLFCIYFIGNFLGLFLPSSLSTDVVRGYYLSKKITNYAISGASVVMDRMMGLYSLLFFCLVAVVWYRVTLDPSIVYSILTITFASIMAGIIAQHEVVPNFLEKYIPFFSKNHIGRNLISIHRAFLSFKSYPLVMLQAFCYSIILQIIRIVTIYITSTALGVEAEFMFFFLIVPITMVVIMVPISISGLGVREGSFAALFALVGIPLNDSFAISSINSIMIIIVSMLGGFIYLFYHEKDQSI